MDNHFTLEYKFVSNTNYEVSKKENFHNLACALDALSYALNFTMASHDLTGREISPELSPERVRKDIENAREYFGSEVDGFVIPCLKEREREVNWLFRLYNMSDDKVNKAEIFDYIFNMVNDYLAKASNNTCCVQNWEQLKGFLIDSFECWKKDQYYRAAGNDKSLFQESSRIIAQLRAENDKLKEQIAAMQNQQQSNGAPSV
jgi:hypothetical protein